MAPEVNEGKYDFKSDIYSLGLTLIELLTVQKPYKECEGALNIYINKKKGILPKSFDLITDQGIKDFIILCLRKENIRPSAKELLEKNKWLNDKTTGKNNIIIEIKGALRQKNFYLNTKYKSGGCVQTYKAKNSFNKSIIKYNSRAFKTFNLRSKKSWKTNNNYSEKFNDNINYNNNDNLSSSFSFKNLIINKSTTTSNIHKSEEENNNNENNSNTNSKNASQEFNSINNVNSTININSIKNENDTIVNKPIIKERNNFNLSYGKSLFSFDKDKDKDKKFFSPDEKNKSFKINHHLNFSNINIKSLVNNNEYQKLNSFRELTKNNTFNINNILTTNSAIKAINIHYDENKINDYFENDENNNDDENYINYNIIYTIILNNNKNITCEYNYEKDSVDIIIKNLKEIMNLDMNDIILLKNEFSKKLSGFMNKKKLQIFFEKYDMILNRCKILGKICKKFDKILNEKNIKDLKDINNNNAIIEKIKDFQSKKNAINYLNNITSKK